MRRISFGIFILTVALLDIAPAYSAKLEFSPEIPEPGMAIIYHYRAKKGAGSVNTWRVLANGWPITRMDNGGYYKHIVKPGLIEYQTMPHATFFGKNQLIVKGYYEPAFNIKINAGETKYVRWKTVWGGKVKIEETSSDQSIATISKLKPLYPAVGQIMPDKRTVKYLEKNKELPEIGSFIRAAKGEDVTTIEESKQLADTFARCSAAYLDSAYIGFYESEKPKVEMLEKRAIGDKAAAAYLYSIIDSYGKKPLYPYLSYAELQIQETRNKLGSERGTKKWSMEYRELLSQCSAIRGARKATDAILKTRGYLPR